MNLLANINFPADIKKLSLEELPQLCRELRAFIIEQTAKNPGHLGASLGTIELTVAIHYVFNTPNDKLVWDVGHQAYGHKILTGRKDRFSTNRKLGGISGFPRIAESEYDAFGTGHSSTSISAALGMAVADRLAGNTEVNHIAVIGDGAMGGGMAFEALNQAGDSKENLLVILNDNKISIDESVGAMSQQLLRITSSYKYNQFKEKMWNFFTLNTQKSNAFTRMIRNWVNSIKGGISNQSNMFNQLGFRYFGPTDGHDVISLVKILSNLKNIKGPRLLHIITVKGKGLEYAEANQVKFHAPGKFDPETGTILDTSHNDSPSKYQDVFGETILELARGDVKVVGITPAMATGCSLTIMRKEFPERVFDVGIAEQHAVTFSAGLAINGYIPFCNIYSSFFQRGYDQVIHDIALQNLPVVICLDRAGIVGEDGPTHHGAFDLAFLRAVPNLIIASPMNEIELRQMLYTAYCQREKPFVIRYPRGRGVLQNWKVPFEKLPIGKAQILKKGEKMAVLSLGPLGNFVAEALETLRKENIMPAHINMRFLKPLDYSMLKEISSQYNTLITVEDGTELGGLYSAVSEYLSENHLQNKLYKIALPDKFIEHGSADSLYAQLGMDKKGIADLIRKHY
jgi:1-deoxy-D-xylulose-5-phosphate synthase